jgi:hypothetical protein
MNQQVRKPFNAATSAELEELGFTPLTELDNSRYSVLPSMRLEKAREAAQKLRGQILSDDTQVDYYQSVSLIRAPYPTKYGLLNANTVKSPFMHIVNRLFIVQFRVEGAVKTLLFSPSDYEANRETPYFKRMIDKYGALAPMVSSFLAPVESSVEKALEEAGIKPEEVDYISYDHLHTQDIRKWLGDDKTPGYFPNARLLIMKQEWDSTTSLLPQQKDWYCPHGIDGVPADRVILLENSVRLGASVALVRTPGHTEGNHSLVAHTPEGLLVTSENGVSADSYSPAHSNIPGVRDYAKATGMEVILNGNTLENSLDQYISMVVEKTIAGPRKDQPEFCNFVPSSELTHYWAFPGLKPTYSFGELKFGFVNKSSAKGIQA